MDRTILDPTELTLVVIKQVLAVVPQIQNARTNF
jgi:hypothetical protein